MAKKPEKKTAKKAAKKAPVVRQSANQPGAAMQAFARQSLLGSVPRSSL
jgi:hypothetical protein